MAEPVTLNPDDLDERLFRDLRGLLGNRDLRTEMDLIAVVEHGLPTRVLSELRRAGLTEDEIHRLVIRRRILSRRRARRRKLTPVESDRALRLARIVALASEVFGERGRALRWLRKPKHRFAGRVPLDVIATEPGGRIVEEMLYQVDDGIW